MKSVCVIGAGPGGLVAAKVLSQTGHFKVSVFEKKARIGGIWALDRGSNDGFLDPNTPTNLSRFAVAFADLDWHSVDLNRDVVNGSGSTARNDGFVPMFPKAWMVGRYLETYRKRYIPEGTIECGTEVIQAEKAGDKWQITTRNAKSDSALNEFDYLVMASGFFAAPRLMSQDVPKVSDSAGVKMVHSSRFAKLDDLFTKGQKVPGKTILMIGGGNSSGETAASIAMQLSDSQWSPDRTRAEMYKGCKIVHVTPRPIYPVPPFIEIEEGSRSYVPLDYKLYDLGKRPSDMPSYAGRQTKEVKDIVHNMIQTLVGGDQSDINSALVSVKDENRSSAYVALSETYSEFVRSGLIEVNLGRVIEVRDVADSGCSEATVRTTEGETRMKDVAAVVYATGYTPSPALDILDENTKGSLEYDPSSMRLPLILEQWQTFNRKIPDLSFIGFYQGPYWGVMEMQARLTAARWLTGDVPATQPYEESQKLMELRKGMREDWKDIPQYGFSDYLGYMEDVASELGLLRNDQKFDAREGCTTPARYLYGGDEQREANETMNDLHKIWHDCVNDARYVPRAVFRSLQGEWSLHRRIDSALSTFPSGTFHGTASFHPRFPSADKTGKKFDLEYLYVEHGDFQTSTGFSMKASRSYVYRYSEEEDRLSVWFVKPDNDLEVDYLFHDLAFDAPDVARKSAACIARADHLCVKDMYTTEYRLPLRGVSLRDFQIKHSVKGPNKDYVATADYERVRHENS